MTSAVALMAAAMFVVSTSRDDAPVAIDNAMDISAGSAAAVGDCTQATNLAHAQAGRATRFLLFVWANGSNTYLGLLWTNTSLQEESAGSFAMVDNCDAAPAAVGWPTVGLDLASTRAVLDETMITPENVGTLGRAWEMTGLTGVSGTPIVSDGTLYAGDWTGTLHAVDPVSGEMQWMRDIGEAIPGSVAIDDTRVFAGTWDGRLVASNRSDGAEAWAVDIDTHEVAVFYGSPVYVDGKVLVPTSSDEWWDGGEFTFRGSVVAFDAATGDELWRYWTSCGAENAGQSNCAADAAEGAGVGLWGEPAVDIERGLVYVGTGNQYGPPASDRSDSIIALDLNTGEERWHHQFTEGDFWNIPGEGDPESGVGPDADARVASLFEVGGVPAVGIGDKGGTYYALNRETGEVLWERKLTDGSIQGGVMTSAAVVPGDRVGRTDPVIYVTSNRGGQNADLAVLDAATGNVLGTMDVGGSVVSPPTWANGLIYLADNTGRIAVYQGVDQLERVWEWDTPAPAGGGISVVNGMAYAGWGYALTPESPDGGLLAFRLGGDPPDGGGEPADGAAIFQTNCASCHGADGSGGAGPDLRGVIDAHGAEAATEVITNGRGEMPAWGGVLMPEEIAAVVEYLGTLEGGEPHHDDHHGDTTTTMGGGDTTTTAHNDEH